MVCECVEVLCGVELALKPSLNSKLVPAHAALMDASSNNADAGVPSSSDVGAAAGGGSFSSVG